MDLVDYLIAFLNGVTFTLLVVDMICLVIWRKK